MRPRSPAHSAFGSAVKQLRRERGLSQEQLALDSGLDRSYVGGIERGERNPSLANVFKLAYALDVQPSDIHKRAELALTR